MNVLSTGAVAPTGITKLSEPLKSIGADAASFTQMLSNAGLDAINNMKSAESLSVQALTANASIREVASAVMAAEQTLQVSIAVRDKIVSAYLELSRMSI
ncbi:MAG: flagellar hook-basal body complex protein FliE [Rhizobiaceae bacterium]